MWFLFMTFIIEKVIQRVSIIFFIVFSSIHLYFIAKDNKVPQEKVTFRFLIQQIHVWLSLSVTLGKKHPTSTCE